MKTKRYDGVYALPELGIHVAGQSWVTGQTGGLSLLCIVDVILYILVNCILLMYIANVLISRCGLYMFCYRSGYFTHSIVICFLPALHIVLATVSIITCMHTFYDAILEW